MRSLHGRHNIQNRATHAMECSHLVALSFVLSFVSLLSFLPHRCTPLNYGLDFYAGDLFIQFLKTAS